MHGAMPRPLRVHVHDEELGKKDDDGRQVPNATLSPRWNSAVPRFRKRRWAALIMAMGLFYVFFKNIPEGLTPVSQRVDRRVPGRTINNYPISNQQRGHKKPPQQPQEPSPPVPTPTPAKKSSKAPKPDDEGSGPLHYYNGEIDFPLLVSSLQAEMSMLRYGVASTVAFVAANLQSASVLIPIACEMARNTKNVVNFAYFGRDDIPLSQLQELNGAKDGCEVMWHDARPDQSVYSSDERFRQAVKDAMGHINMYVRPEAFLRVESLSEEKPFIDALKSYNGFYQKPIVEIPAKGTNSLMWLTRLDAKSLSTWQNLDIQILIQVTKESVGGLSQLQRSMYTADYTGHRYPHITFEVPADLDVPSLNVVDNFQWPPFGKNGEKQRSKVSIRKKISRKHTTPLESAIRTVEEFYPMQPTHEHLLVLSADVQLSPMWYHYLIFNVLEYGYSHRSFGQIEPGLLAGISLVTPLTQIDQETPFKPPSWTAPTTWDPDLEPPKMESPDTVPFMWQAPDTVATLYFGHKWRELHSFLSLRLETTKNPTPRKIPQNIAPFAEPLNELMELRGWYILYPNLPAHHIAIYQPNLATREEFTPPAPKADGSREVLVVDKDTDPYIAPEYSPTEGRFSGPADVKSLASDPIHGLIPNKGVLSSLRLLPILDSSGNPTTASELLEDSHSRRDIFRTSLGGCSPGIIPQANAFGAEDMFCDASGNSYTGDSYSGSLLQPDAAMSVDWEQVRLAEEERKNYGLGDAMPIDIVNEQVGQDVHEEFLAHLQRQGSGLGSELAKIQGETGKMTDDPFATYSEPMEAEKPAGW